MMNSFKSGLPFKQELFEAMGQEEGCPVLIDFLVIFFLRERERKREKERQQERGRGRRRKRISSRLHAQHRA